MRGPIFTLLHLSRDVHPWVLSVFCDPKSCYEQYTNYTLSVRLRWNNPLMRASAWLLSRFVPALVRSAGGVPVYRRSVQIKRTFAQSLSALKRGESLIIYPDVNYMSTDDEMGEIYTGFLLLGQLYHKEVGENLSFVPVDVDMRARALRLGRPVEFDGARLFADERDRVAEALRAEFARLGIKQV